MFDILDCLKVADVLLLLWPTNTETLKRDQLNVLNAAFAQGSPSTLNVVSGLPQCGKHRESIKKTLEKLMNIWLVLRHIIKNLSNI